MNWKTWLINYCPKDWTISDILQFINLDCPNVTADDIKAVLLNK